MIYLDYNATTPLDPAVVEAMLPYLREQYGNPSSTHALGKTAHDAVERARQQVADLLDADPEEIVFCGGGTEASNHALKGAVFAKLHGLFGRWARGAHVVTTAVEHPATRQPRRWRNAHGCVVAGCSTALMMTWAPRAQRPKKPRSFANTAPLRA